MSSETFKTIDNLVRKWGFAFNLDDHHAHKLRDLLERRARRLTSAYERGRCGNFDAYIAVGLSKYAARDAARCKDQMSLHAEVSLDEPVNGEETDGDTRLDLVADDGLAAVRNRRKRNVWEVVALLPPALPPHLRMDHGRTDRGADRRPARCPSHQLQAHRLPQGACRVHPSLRNGRLSAHRGTFAADIFSSPR